VAAKAGISRPELEARLWPRAQRIEQLCFRTAPLLAAAVCFALGEGLGLFLQRPPHLALLLAAVSATLCALVFSTQRRAPYVATVAICAFWAVVGLWSERIEPIKTQSRPLLTYADGLSRTVEAKVTRIRELRPGRADDAMGLDSDPDQWDEHGEPALSVDLAVTVVEDVTPDTARMVPANGGLRILLLRNPGRAKHSLPAEVSPVAAPQLHCGDIIQAPVRLRIPERYRDPGAWQYADSLLDQGITATGSVRADQLHIDNATAKQLALTNGFSALRCRIYAAQSWAATRLPNFVSSRVNRRLPAMFRLTLDDAGMLNAMLFGDRSRLTKGLRVGFERTGSFHLFVVSGMHVALLAGFLFWIARRFRLGDAAATLLTLAFTAAYALLTGFGVPVQRALLMTVAFLLARLLWRDRNVLNALGAAALAVLVWSPRALFEASFQMTFLAIVAIGGIAVPLGERTFLPYARAARLLNERWRDVAMPPHLAQLRVMLRLWGEALAGVFGRRTYSLPSVLLRTALWAAELALIGIVAEAVMALPMAMYFHRATVFALPANMLSVPLVVVLAPLGLMTFLASLVSSWFAAIPGATLAVLLHLVTGAINRLSHAHAADIRVPGPTLLHTLAALAVLAFCFWAVRRSRAMVIVAIAVLSLVPLAALLPSVPVVHKGLLEVTAIDVGQGDSLLVAGPGGRTMLIDAGGPTGAAANAENAAGAAAFDIGEEVVSPYLWSRQMRRIDVLVLTHAHSDHMGGMPAVLHNFRPRELWVGVDPDSEHYRELLAEAIALGVRVRYLRAGDHIDWNSVGVDVLAPARGYANSGPPVNDDSLVLRLRYGKASALLEGDAQAASEDAMVARAGSGDPAMRIGPDTLLKVAHHGSRTSTTPEFMRLAEPEDAVISVGANNTFGHPREEVLGRLAAAHVKVYRTDRDGATTFLLSPDGRIVEANFASNP